VVDADEHSRHAVSVLLKSLGHEPVAVGSARAALAELAARSYVAIFADNRVADAAFVAAVRDRAIETAIVVLTPNAERVPGVYAQLAKPPRADELAAIVERADERARLYRENRALKAAATPAARAYGAAENIVSRSPQMIEILRTTRKIAGHDTTTLLTGESGTGKELLARTIHAQSRRHAGPFVAVNCGAIPEALVESELFGHKLGAFTDAVRDKSGYFAEAHRGTLLLDEVGELPLPAQVKLLRALQEHNVRPIGASEDEAIDVRVIAATTRDLAADVARGRFREDLFYRLNVIAVHVPPLRERSEDIEPLVTHFIAVTSDRLRIATPHVAPEALARLQSYGWPGNVRELQNVIERALVLCEGETLTVADLPAQIASAVPPKPLLADADDLSIKKASRQLESTLIRRALEHTGGNRTNAAKLLEISPRALLYKLREYGLDDA
jgi:two-component system response regulator AtoC